MRHFPSSWETFLGELARWGGLTTAARRAFLDGLRPGMALDPDTRSGAVDELRDAGFLEQASGSGGFRVRETHAGFHQLMKGLQGHPVFAGAAAPDQAALCAYLAEHYSAAERSALHHSLALLPNDLPRVARLVSSVEWIEEFLAREPGEPARRVVRFFMEQRDRVPVRDLEEYFPSLESHALFAALTAGLKRAVLFLGLRREDLEPLVGIWPSAARRLHRLAVVLAPRPVQAAASFCHPWLVEDMTTVLLAARAEPVRVRRGDERPFSRFVEETAERLLSFPAWLEAFTGMGLEARVGLALRGLRIAGLLAPDAGARGSPALHPRTGWREWTAAPLGERLRLLVAALSPAGGVLDGVFDLLDEDQGPGEEETPAGMIRTVLQAFTSVPATSYIRFSDFVDYQAAIGAPSGVVEQGDGEQPAGGAAPGRRARGGLSADPAAVDLPVVSTDEALEDLWKFVLHRVFSRALLALGGAEAGVTDNGQPCFRITDTGRRLLSRSPLPQAEARLSPQLVVQPTFEVVFLSPSPAAEAILARFCERKGREVGLLFRLTKHSVTRAAASGLDSEEVLGSLARFSRSPIPANVDHEVRGWLEAAHGEGGREGGEA